MKPRENPFRVERMHSLPFEPVGLTWAELWNRLERLRFRGAIVGPRGSGKSTLLRRIGEELERGGGNVVRLSLNDASARAAKRHIVRQIDHCPVESIVLLDGYEQLSAMQRMRVALFRGRGRGGEGGLIVTAHHRTMLPTLIHTRTSPQLLAVLVAQLAPDGAGADMADLEALWRHHGGNVREAMMALYDRCGEEAHGGQARRLNKRGTIPA